MSRLARFWRDLLRAEVEFQIRYAATLAAVLGVLYALTNDGEAIGEDIAPDGAPSHT